MHDGCAVGFRISGHAGYADKGHDVVCACVSSAVQMAANTVTEVIGAKAAVEAGNNTISFMLSEKEGVRRDNAKAVLMGLRLHLSFLSDEYGNYIVLKDSEVY